MTAQASPNILHGKQTIAQCSSDKPESLQKRTCSSDSPQSDGCSESSASISKIHLTLQVQGDMQDGISKASQNTGPTRHPISLNGNQLDTDIASSAQILEDVFELREKLFARPHKYKADQFSGKQKTGLFQFGTAEIVQASGLMHVECNAFKPNVQELQPCSIDRNTQGNTSKVTIENDASIPTQNEEFYFSSNTHRLKNTKVRTDQPGYQCPRKTSSNAEMEAIRLVNESFQAQELTHKLPHFESHLSPLSKTVGHLRPFPDADDSITNGSGRLSSFEDLGNKTEVGSNNGHIPEICEISVGSALDLDRSKDAQIPVSQARSQRSHMAGIRFPRHDENLLRARRVDMESLVNEPQIPVEDLGGPRLSPKPGYTSQCGNDILTHDSLKSQDPNISGSRRSRNRGKPVANRRFHHAEPQYERSYPNTGRYRDLEHVANAFNGLLADTKQKEVKYCEEILIHREQIANLKGRLNEMQERHEQTQKEHKQLVVESTQLWDDYNQLTLEAAQRNDQMKELETRSSHLHNQREALKLETKTFRSKLETTQVTQNKLRDTVCESKDRLTNTIAEHRSRWKDSNDAFQSHMRDAEEEHQISFRKLEQVINDGQSLCKNQKKYLESKISLLQEELGNASSNFRELTLEIGILKGDFPREQETTKILEEQLAESKKRENFLKQLEARMVNIFARLEKVDLKAEKAKELPSLISERLSEIAELVQSVPQLQDPIEVRNVIESFQEKMASQLMQEMKQMMTEQSNIQGKLQALKNCVNGQAILNNSEQKKRQEVLLQRISEKREENSRLSQNLQSKEGQIIELTKAVVNMDQWLKKATESTAHMSPELAPNAELKVAHELLTNNRDLVTQLQSGIQAQRVAYESRQNELENQLQIAQEELRITSKLLEELKESRAFTEHCLAVASQERHRELELQLEEKEATLKALQQQHHEKITELSEFKIGEGVAQNRQLRKELKAANQRITNLTIKLREMPMPANEIDQVYPQLDELQEMLRGIKEDMMPELIEASKLFADMRGYLTDASKRPSASPKQAIDLDDDQLPMKQSFSRGQPEKLSKSQNDEGNISESNRGGREFLEVSRTDPLDIPFRRGLDNLKTSSSNKILEPESPYAKRVVIRSPIEDLYQSSDPSSVAFGKLYLSESESDSARPRSIMRTGASMQETATRGTVEPVKKPLVATHIGHTRYNRPVGSQNIVPDVALNYVDKRKRLNQSQIPGSRVLSNIDKDREQRNKRNQAQPPVDRLAKRTKPYYDIKEDEGAVSSSGRSNTNTDARIGPLQHSQRDSTEVTRFQPQDDDVISQHFHIGAAEVNESATTTSGSQMQQVSGKPLRRGPAAARPIRIRHFRKL